MRCCSPARRCRCSAGWARPSTSSARKAATSGCGCSWGSGRPWSRPAPWIPPASRNWPSAPWRWRGWCPRTPTRAWPTPPRRRSRSHSTWWTRAEPTTEQLVARAAAAEEAALAVPGITNSEGAEAGFGRTEAFLVTSAGFAGKSARTSHSVSASALAGAGTAMQRDYDYHSTVHLADLDDPAAIGRSAGGARDRQAQPGATGHRQTAGHLRSRASPAGCSAISPARSTAPRWRAAPRS